MNSLLAKAMREIPLHAGDGITDTPMMNNARFKTMLIVSTA